MSEQLSHEDLQALERFLDGGIFQGAEKLADLSGTAWELVTSSVQELPIVRVISLFHADQAPCYGVHMESKAPLPIHVLVFFPKASAQRLATAVVSRSKGLQALKDPLQAVLPEVSNIIGQAVLKSIANALGVSLVLSSPALKVGTKSSLFAEAVGKLEGHEETAILMRLDMSSGQVASECSLALVLHMKIMRDLIRKATE